MVDDLAPDTDSVAEPEPATHVARVLAKRKARQDDDDVALHYKGDDEGRPAVSGVPARDLTVADMRRLVYVRTHGERRDERDEDGNLLGLEGLRPGDKGYADALHSIEEELTATGIYRG